MKSAVSVLAVTVVAALCGCAEQRSEPYPEQQSEARELARSLLIVDTHVDVPYALQEEYYDVTVASEKGDFDYPRALGGGLNAPFMSIYIPAKHEEDGALELADELIDLVETIVQRAPEKFEIAHSVADVQRIFSEGRIALPLGMENGAPIEGDLQNLQHFYERGVRYITLTHSEANHISDSSYDENRPWGGLSPFGRELVAEMNRIGVMIDVSHVSDEAFYDVVEVSATPVIASHSSVREFTPGWERNMSDAMIRRLAENGGVIQINFGSTFVNPRSFAWYEVYDDKRDAYLEENGYEEDGDEAEAFREAYREELPYPYADLDDVLDNIDHVRDLVGIDHVGLGSDFDGVGDSLPTGLKDVSGYPNLIAGLLARGYSAEDIEKVLSGNLLRVWRAVERHASP